MPGDSAVFAIEKLSDWAGTGHFPPSQNVVAKSIGSAGFGRIASFAACHSSITPVVFAACHPERGRLKPPGAPPQQKVQVGHRNQDGAGGFRGARG